MMMMMMTRFPLVTKTTTMEFMRDGNEDEIDDTGRTAFETLRATENNHHHHDDEDDEDDEENDDRDDDDDKGEGGGGPSDVLQRTIIETMVKNHSSVGDAEKNVGV